MEIEEYQAIRLENQLCFPLYACAKEVIRRYRKPLESLGLTYTQYIVMMVLWEYGTMSEKQIGEKLLLDSGTLTPVLKRLERQEYLCRSRLPDNERILQVSLTQKGNVLKKEAVNIPGLMQGCIPLDDTELQQLKKLLNTALIRMEKANEN